MFEHIGTDPDEESRRRRAVASVWATLGLGALLGFTMGAVALLATEELRPPVIEVPFAPLVELVPEVPDEPPPGLPSLPAGPPPAGGGPSDEVSTPPDPVTPPDDPSPLKEPVEQDVANVANTTPRGPGVGPGIDGPPRPPGGGGGNGGGGEGGGGRTVHHTDLQVKKRVKPEYPAAARSLGLGEQKCFARVEISDAGEPVNVTVTGCSPLFHPETEAALWGWRWYPVRVDGQKTSVVTTISVLYRLD